MIKNTVPMSKLANMIHFDISECPVVRIPTNSIERNPLKSNIEVLPDFIGQGVEIWRRGRLKHLVILHQY